MNILGVGDSFMYGDELADREQCFGALVAKELGYGFINKGVRASGNIKMIRQLVEEPLDNYSMVLIGWSGFDRIEMCDEMGLWETWPGAHANDIRVPSKQHLFRATAVDYYNRYHVDDYLYRQQYLTQVVLAQSYLKLHNKSYVMLDTFINHKYSGRHSETNNDLISKIDTTNYLGWPNESMQEWTEHAPKGPHFHFLEEGHRIVAEKILKHLTNT